MKNINEVISHIQSEKLRSAWDKGVAAYALDLLNEYVENSEYNGLKENNFMIEDSPSFRKNMLNGAQDWSEYSEGGNSLIYNEDIAQRLCSPSVFKRKKEGDLNPDSRMTWIDLQSVALRRAMYKISSLCR